MSNPSIESSPSLTDLFEYDEYDSFENPYAEIDRREPYVDGIPLSVELSESLLCRRQCDESVSHEIALSPGTAAIDTDANDHFVRAPEIFLRIDNNNDVVPVTTSANRIDGAKIKTERDRATGSSESSGSDASVVPATDASDIVELHYENEFIDANADECDDTELMRRRSTTQFENDNEQLLFEGTQIRVGHVPRFRNTNRRVDLD